MNKHHMYPQQTIEDAFKHLADKGYTFKKEHRDWVHRHTELEPVPGRGRDAIRTITLKCSINQLVEMAENLGFKHGGKVAMVDCS